LDDGGINPGGINPYAYAEENPINLADPEGLAPCSPALRDDTVARLQAWYQKHCNGEWENDRGVSIESTDNPGWWVKIDLRGTDLESKSFDEVRRGATETLDPQPLWMRCYVDDERVFNGAGDQTTLQEILNIFLNWSDV